MTIADDNDTPSGAEPVSVVSWEPEEPGFHRPALFSRADPDLAASMRLASGGAAEAEGRGGFVLNDELLTQAAEMSFAADALGGQVKSLAKDLAAADIGRGAVPATLSGELVQPSGAAGAWLAVTLRRRGTGGDDEAAPFTVPLALSDGGGRFSLALPDAELPADGLDLVVQGADTLTTLPLSRAVIATGRAGTLALDRPLAPVAADFRAQIIEAEGGQADKAVTLGEEECARRFSSNAGVIDRYRWSTLIRLVEPKVYPPQGTTASGNPVPDRPVTTLDALIFREGASRVGMRVPIGAPIDIDRFRTDLEIDPGNVPKAGSIGLGYLLGMSQAWIPRGLSLGNLLYSLPLAPGEEQRVVVSESIERLTVRESERSRMNETQSQTDRVSRTTSQLFGSSLKDAASGGSAFESEGDSGNLGGGFSILGIGMSGGGSWSSTNGASSSWQKSSRDFASWAAENFHSSLSRRAAISRQSTSVSVRLATLEDRDELASKIVANRNRNHALTLQFWEIMRNYTVTSDVDNVSLVCFVPLEVIPWTLLQPAWDGPGGSLSANPTRNYLVTRYATVLRHADVLRRRLRFQPRLHRALRNIEELSANPMIRVDAEAEARRLSLRIAASGTFLPFDQLDATVVTTAGRRIGPARLSPASVEEPVARVAVNRGDVVDALLARREDVSGAESTRAAYLVLPDSVSAEDIARIEIGHRITSWSYRPPARNANTPQDGALEVEAGTAPPRARNALSFAAGDLTRLVGAPQVWDVEVESLDHDGETIAQDLTGADNAVRMPARLIVAPDPEDPVFGREELQLAEELLTHLRENALAFSKHVWGAFGADELVMMLEPFTIGLPLGDGTLSEVPLVSCISTRIRGFFGNSMILSFHIPAQMAAESGTTSGEIEDRLMEFHRQSFRPPRTEIALASGGMLGEAVLGGCNSAEKIDLTRLWNWKNAPLPLQADDPNTVQFGAERLLGSSSAEAANRLGPVAAPRYDILPASLPTSALALANLLAALPASQLPDDLDASELARVFAAAGLTNAAGLAQDVVSKVQAANFATGPSVKDLLDLLTANEALGQAKKVAGLDALMKDPSSFASQLGAVEEGKRDGAAKDMVKELTGGSPLSAGEQADVFGALKDFGGGAGEGAVMQLGLKALLAAFGLPPI